MAQQTPPPGPPPGTPAPGPTGGPPMAAAGKPVDSQGRVLAEWWKRVVAAIIDSVILAIPTWILIGVFSVGLTGACDPDPVTGLCRNTGGVGAIFVGFLLMILILTVVGIAYYVFFHGSERGQTPGKMVMKIQVRDEATGGPVGYGKAGLRWLVAGALGAFTCGIGSLVDVLFPLWDAKRQTLHDKVANTVVIDLAP